MGHISYVIRPRAGLTTGTEIRNIALITFDVNQAIATNQIDPHDPSKGIDLAKEALNTIDAGVPTSTIASLPETLAVTDFMGLPFATYTFNGDPLVLTSTIHWGDGTSEPGILVPLVGGGTIANTHRYAPPVIPPPPLQMAEEGTLFNLAIDFTDAGVADTYTASIDWGDGSPLELASIAILRA